MPGNDKKRSLADSDYDPAKDSTLTRAQAANEGFHTGQGNFRSPSNPTVHGHSSGYHEAVVTTNTYYFLRDAKPTGRGTYILPNAHGNSYFHPYSGREVPAQSLEIVLRLADGYRTDTARTILSAPGGKGAGHTGSGVSLKGQGPAHDLLRRAVMDVVMTDPRTPGFSERSVATLFASITVTSMAPGEIARTLPGGSSTLKSSAAKVTYEVRRNMAKDHTGALNAQLSPAEQLFVRNGAQRFIDSTQEGVIFGRRQLAPDRPTSPRRVSALGIANQVEGGGYIRGGGTQTGTVRLSKKTSQAGLSSSRFFRDDRPATTTGSSSSYKRLRSGSI